MNATADLNLAARAAALTAATGRFTTACGLEDHERAQDVNELAMIDLASRINCGDLELPTVYARVWRDRSANPVDEGCPSLRLTWWGRHAPSEILQAFDEAGLVPHRDGTWRDGDYASEATQQWVFPEHPQADLPPTTFA